MNKKLKISVLGLPLLLVACGGTPSEGPVKLKIWGPNQEQNFLQAKAQEFLEANPDLNVEFEFAAVGEPELKSVLTLDIAGGADVRTLLSSGSPTAANSNSTFKSGLASKNS